MTMDYVQKFDVELDKEIYYAGEIISGRVIVDTLENIKVKGEYQVSSLRERVGVLILTSKATGLEFGVDLEVAEGEVQ